MHCLIFACAADHIRPIAKVIAGIVWGLKNAIANRHS
jgi:hypothetical protein